MKNLINNEGKKVTVSQDVYNEALIAKEEGFMFIYLSDVKGNKHCIISSNI